MKTWPIPEGENQMNKVIKLARTKGPLTVTRNGEPVAVIVSSDEFKALTRPKESVVEFFAPLRRSGIRLARRPDLPRKPRA